MKWCRFYNLGHRSGVNIARLQITATVITLLVLIGGGFYQFGRQEQHIVALERLEYQTQSDIRELRGDLSKVAERVARIEGYLQQQQTARRGN